ncbi:GBS Bsp-like repeat-containing protein [Streptococcus merionis]|uniref:Surface antigen n=1 Tax=Streptococcus merionis TaxID=400065 RepID=A0A239T166_9STRE|nr:GBS Bsp-like repeat-containing protein [Streptococcus merionis]SNU90848.1 surface antigen [Streptococcus merionis]
MTLKKLLLSSLVLGQLAVSGAVLANEHGVNVEVQSDAQRATLVYQGEMPQKGTIQYAIWSEENGKDDLEFYDYQGPETTIDLQNHSGDGTYHIEVYQVKGAEKVLLKATTFQRDTEETKTTAPETTTVAPEMTTNSVESTTSMTTTPSTSSKPEAQAESTTPATTTNQETQLPQAPTTKSRITSSQESEPKSAENSSDVSVMQPRSSRSSIQPRSARSASPSQYRAATPVAEVSSQPRISASVSRDGKINIAVTGVAGQPAEVLLPTWSDKNDQDDINWYRAARLSNGIYYLQVDTKNHKNDTGLYHIHLYIRSKAGASLEGAGLTTVTVGNQVTTPTTPKKTEPAKTTITASQVEKTKGTYRLNIQPEKTVKSIDVAVWSTSNQSNIKWYSIPGNGQSTYSLKVSYTNHQSLAGQYQNHVYINYADGSRLGYVGPTVTLEKPVQAASVSTSARFIGSGTYELTLHNAEAGAYQFAVWSDKNGQDDLIWYDAQPSGNGSHKLQLDLSKHKDSGTYHLHVYKKTSTGQVGVIPSTFTVAAHHLPAAVTKTVATPTIPRTYHATSYPVGQCTWGAKQVAPWVGEWWGNAKEWANVARRLGYSVGTMPRVGAVAVWPTDGNGYGHVGVVTHVESANRIQILESNYLGRQYISNFRGWFDPTMVWNGSGYTRGEVYYIYPKA